MLKLATLETRQTLRKTATITQLRGLRHERECRTNKTCRRLQHYRTCFRISTTSLTLGSRRAWSNSSALSAFLHFCIASRQVSHTAGPLSLSHPSTGFERPLLTDPWPWKIPSRLGRHALALTLTTGPFCTTVCGKFYLSATMYR